MPKVLILSGDSWKAAHRMFLDHDWETYGIGDLEDLEPDEQGPFPEMDLICFLGGTDVDPGIYGAERHPMTQSPDHQRDAFEVAVFNKFKDIPKVGICRGGQLLNVLNGGTMIQHLGKVCSGIYSPWVTGGGEEEDIDVLVDHHQGMVCGEKGSCILHHNNWLDVNHGPKIMMAGYYPETKSLCFQPHPEWEHKGTEDYFFQLLEETLGFKNEIS